MLNRKNMILVEMNGYTKKGLKYYVFGIMKFWTTWLEFWRKFIRTCLHPSFPLEEIGSQKSLPLFRGKARMGVKC